MANPENALGTNGAYGGRTSVNAFNDVLASFNGRGVLSGWACTPDSGLTVTLGGNGTDRDVAIAEDNAGNKTTVNNISQAPVPVTLPAAPANNSRIDSIVAYIEASPSSSGETDNYTAVNLLTVSGAAAATPAAPSDGDIRTAITADGASGPTSYYVVLANVTMASGTTDIDATMISAGTAAQVAADKLDFATLGGNYSTSEINTRFTWINGDKIYKKTIHFGSLPNNSLKEVAHGISNLKYVVDFSAMCYNGSRWMPLPMASPAATASGVLITFSNLNISISTGTDRTSDDAYVTLYYTKTN